MTAPNPTPSPVWVNEFFNTPKWLKHDDLKGKQHTVTIAAVKRESVRYKEKEEFLPIVYFKEFKRGLVCNKGMMDDISLHWGRVTTQWLSRQIIIYPTIATVYGKPRHVIRVSSELPKQPNQD